MFRGSILAGILSFFLAACGDVGEVNNSSADDFGYAPAPDVTGLNNVVHCEPIGRRLAYDDCEAVKATESEVRTGVAAFNVPDPMRRGEAVAVQLIIDRRELHVLETIDAASDLTNAVDNASSGAEAGIGNAVNGSDAAPRHPNRNRTPRQIAAEAPGRTVEYAPQVGRFMRARLTGQGFDITPLTPERQEIPRDGQALWTWQVRALESGRKTLTLTTVAEAIVDGQPYRLTGSEESKTVTVGVSFLDRVRDVIEALPGWLKAIAAVVAALATLVGAWLGLRSQLRRRGEPRPPSPPRGQ
jgi:hypothetical protein